MIIPFRCRRPFHFYRKRASSLDPLLHTGIHTSERGKARIFFGWKFHTFSWSSDFFSKIFIIPERSSRLIFNETEDLWNSNKKMHKFPWFHEIHKTFHAIPRNSKKIKSSRLVKSIFCRFSMERFFGFYFFKFASFFFFQFPFIFLVSQKSSKMCEFPSVIDNSHWLFTATSLFYSRFYRLKFLFGSLWCCLNSHHHNNWYDQ